MLSPYSAQSLAVLQALLPDLAKLAVRKEDYFFIETTAPAGWGFWISSAEDELTVGFAEHHTHFGWHEGDPREDAIEAAAYVEQLRSGQLEVAVWYEEEQCVGASTRRVGEKLEPPTWLQQWWRRKQHLKLRRWSD